MLRPLHRGFTLIEILIVIVILSVTMTFAVLNFGDFGKAREARRTAEQLERVMRYLREDAILSTKIIRMTLTPENYRADEYLSIKETPKQPLPGFTSGRFANGLLVSLPAASPQKMIIIFQPSGALTPFKITIGTKKKPHLIQLTGQKNGKIRLHTP